MRLYAKGEYALPELRQTLYEQLNIMQNRFCIRYVRSASLYFTPTNGFGVDVPCIDHYGKPVETLYCNGPYRPVAEQFDIFGWKID